ncbi:MAG: AAA family ATPase [Acidimicrobiales bacterium]
MTEVGPQSPRDAVTAIRGEVAKVIVGHDSVVSGLLAALLVRGHVLLEGVPGVAKTLLVKTMAAAMDLDVNRVQFTPDLMPSDVIGQQTLEGDTRSLSWRPGPVFTNFLIADEINRTPPKTQAALLEAMEERQVTAGGESRQLPDPFVVVATQNPIEYEGTYPLPEAQLDRFLFKLQVGYPGVDQEIEILRAHHEGVQVHDPASAGVRAVCTAAQLREGRLAVQEVDVEDRVLAYIVDLAQASRESASLELGLSPRGAAMLLHACKAWAWISGRDFVTPDDVKTVARPVMRHRFMVRPELELDGATSDAVVDGLLQAIDVPA